MTDAEAFIALNMVPRIGPVRVRRLLAAFGSPGAVLTASPSALQSVEGIGPEAAKSLRDWESHVDLAGELRLVKEFGARVITLASPDYPALLREIHDPPTVLYIMGDLQDRDRHAIGVIGTRKPSHYANDCAKKISYQLAYSGVTVVSGLARGIDTAAHMGSIDSGTIAVIAGGIDVVYPPENPALQDRIADRGLLIAEQPPGTEPRARHFPYRNRIIDGLSAGTVVIEAAPKSGSLITARLAAEAGREVMAVPGSPLDPRSRGCNQLIREGAILVQNASEIAEMIHPIDNRMLGQASSHADLAPKISDDGSNAERNAVIDLMGMTYVSVDELVRQSGSSQANVQMVLLEMELAGKLERGAGGKVRFAA